MSYRKNKKNHLGLVLGSIIAIVLVGATAMIVTGGKTISFTIGEQTQGQQNPGTIFGQGKPAETVGYEGPTTWQTSGFDGLETGTIFVDDDYTAAYYRLGADGKYTPLGSASDVSSNVNPAAVTFGMQKTDTKLYMTVMPQDGGASDTMYVAPEAIKQSNPRILSYSFFNIDGDTDKEWVFEMDATKVGETGRDTLNPTIPQTLLFYDSVTTFAVVTDGVVHAGTGTKLNTLRQTFTFSEDAAADAEIEYRVSLNQTDPTGFWDEGNSYIMIPNIGKKYFSEATQSGVEGSSYVYHWKLGADLGKANMVVVPDGGDLTIDAFVYITSVFDAATDGIQMTYQVTSISPAQAFTTASDCTKISGYSSGATNC